jgi:hypothetical protein
MLGIIFRDLTPRSLVWVTHVSVERTASIFKVEELAEQPAKERRTENVAIFCFFFLQVPRWVYACSSDLKVEAVGSSETSVTSARCTESDTRR